MCLRKTSCSSVNGSAAVISLKSLTNGAGCEKRGLQMYDEAFWDKRYANPDYLYGTEPNSFLADHLRLLSSPVLSLSEGEGRNAVFLATRGLEVVGVDISAVALEKAQRLAE